VGQVERAVGGEDTAIWRVESGGAGYAPRLFPADEAAPRQHEGETMNAAAAEGLPLPAVFARGSWGKPPALPLSAPPRGTLAAFLQKQPWQTWRLGAAFGRLQAQLHTIAPPPSFASADWIAWAGPEETALQDRLRALPSLKNVLLHLDYHPLNVMTDGRALT